MLALLDLAPKHLLRERFQGRENAVLVTSHPLTKGVIQRRIAHIFVRVSMSQCLQVIEEGVAD